VIYLPRDDFLTPAQASPTGSSSPISRWRTALCQRPRPQRLRGSPDRHRASPGSPRPLATVTRPPGCGLRPAVRWGGHRRIPRRVTSGKRSARRRWSALKPARSDSALAMMTPCLGFNATSSVCHV